MSQYQPVGVHLVGSVPLPSASDVFLQASKALPGRLRRLPDGEAGHRQDFVVFQRDSFSSDVLRAYDASFNTIPVPAPTPAQLEALAASLQAQPLQTRYEDYAKASYATFSSLRASGELDASIKFQVSLPTPVNVLCLVADGYQATVEPFYEEALLRSLKEIEASIPHGSLAVQWDVAAEFAMLEGVSWPHFGAFFSPVKEGVVERLVRLADAVHPDVECGFHLCYGDMAHRHFVEPKDTGLMVEIASAVMERSKRKITWFHLPVPKDRVDETYFAPLKGLELGDTELYLGLAHHDDIEGTLKRIEGAATTGKSFGVGTECGMGRTPPEQLESILNVCSTVTAKVGGRS